MKNDFVASNLIMGNGHCKSDTVSAAECVINVIFDPNHIRFANGWCYSV